MSSSPAPTSSKRRQLDDAYGRASKKTKSTMTDYELWEARVIQHGKTLARNVDMWTKPAHIINAGYEDLTGEVPKGAVPLNEEQRVEYLQAYESLKMAYRTLENDLFSEKLGVDPCGTIKKLLLEGQQSARATDTSTIRNGLPSYHDFSPSINKLGKSCRGYHNTQTGRLLCPIHLSWDNEEDVQRLQHGIEETSPDVFYNFMYEDNKGDPQQASKGLLRGPILVKAYRAIFFGPSSVNSDISDARTTRAGNAVLGCITSVTPAAIAYITTLVRFALSSDTTMTAGDKFKFSHCGFYRTLLEVMDPLEPSSFRKKFTGDLLKWWNEQCFPHVEQPRTRAATSTLSLFLQQEALAESDDMAPGESTDIDELETE
ncbi:hypothetical protein FRC03_012272 [Tulasnella sp. 419]|nr:hypothetical protein FRC03_012272 [Tulasnella sp. 419]